MKKLLSILFLLFAVNSFSQCLLKAEIKYKRSDLSWSKKYNVEVNFMGGSDLNKATGTSNYYIYGVYAIIFWDDDEVTIIDIANDNLLSCSASSIDCDCIKGMSWNFNGKDQNGTYWEVCAKDYCY
jgi:hypothetical protein